MAGMVNVAEEVELEGIIKLMLALTCPTKGTPHNAWMHRGFDPKAGNKDRGVHQEGGSR